MVCVMKLEGQSNKFNQASLKTKLFSLFTVVLSPDMPLYQIAIYGVWIMVIQFAWFSLLVGILSRPSINIHFKKYSHWIDRVLGGAMIALGIKVIATRTN